MAPVWTCYQYKIHLSTTWWKLQASLIFLSRRTCTIGGWLNTFLPHCTWCMLLWIFSKSGGVIYNAPLISAVTSNLDRYLVLMQTSALNTASHRYELSKGTMSCNARRETAGYLFPLRQEPKCFMHSVIRAQSETQMQIWEANGLSLWYLLVSKGQARDHKVRVQEVQSGR